MKNEKLNILCFNPECYFALRFKYFLIVFLTPLILSLGAGLFGIMYFMESLRRGSVLPDVPINQIEGGDMIPFLFCSIFITALALLSSLSTFALLKLEKITVDNMLNVFVYSSFPLAWRKQNPKPDDVSASQKMGEPQYKMNPILRLFILVCEIATLSVSFS